MNMRKFLKNWDKVIRMFYKKPKECKHCRLTTRFINKLRKDYYVFYRCKFCNRGIDLTGFI